MLTKQFQNEYQSSGFMTKLVTPVEFFMFV